MDRSEQLETEARLREALEQAKASYDRAKQDVQRAEAVSADLGSTHPDGSPRLALRNENEARRHYMVALKAFNRFILDGKLAEEPSVRSG